MPYCEWDISSYNLNLSLFGSGLYTTGHVCVNHLEK